MSLADIEKNTDIDSILYCREWYRRCGIEIKQRSRVQRPYEKISELGLSHLCMNSKFLNPFENGRLIKFFSGVFWHERMCYQLRIFTNVTILLHPVRDKHSRHISDLLKQYRYANSVTFLITCVKSRFLGTKTIKNYHSYGLSTK